MTEEKKQEEQTKQQPINAMRTDCIQPEMSQGEKWFNRIVYQGMNYWLNLGISLAVTDLFMAGRFKNFFHKSVNQATTSLSTLTGMKRSNARWLSEIALGTFSLNSGGNLLLIPTKLAEDNKRSLVYWLNEKLGVDQTAPDGHKMTKDEIYIEQEQDPQSWMRMIGRRLIGWGSTTAVGLTLDRVLAQKLTHTTRNIDGDIVTNKPGQAVFTEGVQTAVNYVLPGIKDNKTVQRYIGYAALDSIYTAITSKLMHLTNGAKKKHAVQEVDGSREVPATAPAAAEPAQEEKRFAPDVSPSKRSAQEIVNRGPKENHAQSIAASRTGAHMHLGA